MDNKSVCVFGVLWEYGHSENKVFDILGEIKNLDFHVKFPHI